MWILISQQWQIGIVKMEFGEKKNHVHRQFYEENAIDINTNKKTLKRRFNALQCPTIFKWYIIDNYSKSALNLWIISNRTTNALTSDSLTLITPRNFWKRWAADHTFDMCIRVLLRILYFWNFIERYVLYRWKNKFLHYKLVLFVHWSVQNNSTDTQSITWISLTKHIQCNRWLQLSTRFAGPACVHPRVLVLYLCYIQLLQNVALIFYI